MRELKPYRTLPGLQKAIDNGGRFYNLFDSAEDKVVTRGELAKAAGVFSAGQQAFLFFEMARCELSPAEQEASLGLLDANLRKRHLRLQPKTLIPSRIESDGAAGQSVIVTGYPRFIENRSRFSGMILIPAGKVLVPIPIFRKFDVYEMFDDEQLRFPNSVIAMSRGHRLEHTGAVRFGGVLRKLTHRDKSLQDKTQKPHKFFLETVFYTRL